MNRVPAHAHLAVPWRFDCFWDAPSPDALADEVLKGAPFRNLKDANGHKLTDAHLVELAITHHGWLKEVYGAGIEWVHLSTTQVLSPWEMVEEKDELEEGQLRIGMWFPIRRSKIPPEFMAGMLAAMAEATSDLLAYFEIWRRRKGMPPGQMRS